MADSRDRVDRAWLRIRKRRLSRNDIFGSGSRSYRILFYLGKGGLGFVENFGKAAARAVSSGDKADDGAAFLYFKGDYFALPLDNLQNNW